MTARTRGVNWLMGVVALGLSFLVLAGCRSGSGSHSSGCGGGCCRGQGYETGVATPAVTGGPVRSGLEPSAPDASGTAVRELPATTTNARAKDLYGGQKTCPVTGEELGSMGPATPVKVKGQTVYVCCRGCAAKVQRDPDTYLAKVPVERSGR